MGTNKQDWKLDEKTGLMEYVPHISAARRKEMAAEDAAYARKTAAVERRASFRVVGGTDYEARQA